MLCSAAGVTIFYLKFLLFDTHDFSGPGSLLGVESQKIEDKWQYDHAKVKVQSPQTASKSALILCDCSFCIFEVGILTVGLNNLNRTQSYRFTNSFDRLIVKGLLTPIAFRFGIGSRAKLGIIILPIFLPNKTEGRVASNFGPKTWIL